MRKIKKLAGVVWKAPGRLFFVIRRKLLRTALIALADKKVTKKDMDTIIQKAEDLPLERDR